jgi:putative ABC transport system permease protein
MGWLNRLRDTFRRHDLDHGFDEEAQFHLDEETAANVRRGMAPEEARLTAIRRLGNLTSARERVRDADAVRWLADLLQDIRYGVRSFRRSPSFTGVAIVTLALGIGATTAVFSLVNGVLLRPLTYANAERLVRVFHNRPDKAHATLIKFNYFTALRDDSRAFDALAAYDSYSNVGARQLEAVATANEGPVGLGGTRVSPDIFRMLGAQPAIGRMFVRQDAEDGHNHLAILSFSAWQKYFGGQNSVIGQPLLVDRAPYTVIGVAPRGFYFPDRETEVWIPLRPAEIPPQGAPRSDSPDSGVLQILALLKRDTPVETATADAERVFRAVDASYGQENVKSYASIKQRVGLVPLKDELIGTARPALRMLPFAVALVLLIACANVANLLIARSASKQREMAIRASLGAGQFRLARQLLTEGALLSFAGGLAGAALAIEAIRVIQTLAPRDLPRIEEVTVSASVLAYAMTASVLTALLSSAAPAIRAARTDHMAVMRNGQAQQLSGLNLMGPHKFRGWLVVAEVAMATVLLIGAGLLVRSFTKLTQVNTGYQPSHVLTFQVALPPNRYAPDFYEALLARLGSDPSIEYAGTTDKLPLLGVGGLFLQPAGLPISSAQDDRLVLRVITTNYLRAMGTKVVRGRGLLPEDREGSLGAMLINQTLARRHFGQEDPVGHWISVAGRSFQVVGVVEDIRHGGLDVEAQSEYYVGARQSPVPVPPRPYVVVRTKDDPRASAPALRAIVQQIDPQASVDLNIASMQNIVSESIARPRFYASLLAIFAAIAAGLAAIGIYGVVGYAVVQRTPELGVRLALGATRSNIFRLVLGQGFSLVFVGLSIGLACAAALTRFITAMLFGVTSLDAVTFCVVGAMFVTVAALAIYLPARRATRVDPLVAFRAE